MRIKTATAFVLGLTMYLNGLFADEKPTVAILATGGTIAGTGTSASSNAYSAGDMAINTLIASAHGVENLANLKFNQVANIPSPDMNDEVWLKLAKAAQEYLDDDSISGIVITHGTDTMEETAYFLNLVLKTNKPVIITGAMRPATALSADDPIDLYNAVAAAASEEAKGKGVLIVMDDRIFDARDCSKTNTSTLDTFQSWNSGALGYIDFGHIKFYKAPLRKHTMDTEFNIKEIKFLPKVDIVSEYEGGITDILKFVASRPDVKGIVVAGVGDGNLYNGYRQAYV